MIQLTTHLAMTADDYCYIVGKPRQRAAEAHILPGEGKNTTQEGRPSDG